MGEASVFEGGGAEVEEEADFQAGGLQVIDNLRLLDPAQFGQRLEFDNDRIEADEVRAVGGIQLISLVKHRQFDFALERDALILQLDGQGFLLDRLQKPAAQLPMHLHRGAENGISPRVLFVFFRRQCHALIPPRESRKSIRRFRRLTQISRAQKN